MPSLAYQPTEEDQVGYDIWSIKASLSQVLQRMEHVFAGRTDEAAEFTKALACYSLQTVEQLDMHFSVATRNPKTN